MPGPAADLSSSERSPLLAAEEMARPNAHPSPSTLSLLASHSFAGTALFAQLGLVVATAVLWRALWVHPAGLFTYHPSFQSLAVLGFFEGVLLLQPQPASIAVKRKGLLLHQVFQFTSLALIVAGAAFIVYNKAIRGAKHITTWHARFGVATLVLILLQIAFGAVVVFAPLQRLVGGESKAKSLWKYHRISGYLTLALLIVTPLLALASDWVRLNTDKWERWTIGTGLVVAGVGALTRIQTSKLGLKRN